MGACDGGGQREEHWVWAGLRLGRCSAVVGELMARQDWGIITILASLAWWGVMWWVRGSDVRMLVEGVGSDVSTSATLFCSRPLSLSASREGKFWSVSGLSSE